MRSALIASAAVVYLVQPGTVLAQTVVDPGANDVSPKADEAAETQSEPAETAGDIVVTALRRSQRLQDVPVAISAFGQGALANRGAISLDAIAPRVPGFYLGSFGASRPQLYIRGIGTRQFDPGSESSIGVFVDDVYIGRTSSILGSLHDIERVEVLRGPQGTLYGRNTIAGAINVVTKTATSELSGEAEAGLSNYGGYNLFGAISGPVSSSGNVRLRLAGWRDSRGGYFTNVTTGNRSLGIDTWGVRGRADYDLQTAVTGSTIVEYDVDGNGAAFAGRNEGSVTNPLAVILQRPGTVSRLVTDRYSAALSEDPTLHREIVAATQRFNLDVGAVTIDLITGYRHQLLRERRDLDGSSLDIYRQSALEKSDQISQEIRLSSQRGGFATFNDRFEWLAGLYFFREKASRSDSFDFGPDTVVTAAAGSRLLDTVSLDYLTRSFAAFGQGTLKLGGGLTLTLSGRYTRDRKTADATGEASRPGFPVIPVPYKLNNIPRTDESLDPKVVLAYQASKDVNLYASFSQGFKSGGYQYVPFTQAQASSTFGPEKIKAYEIGLKSQFLDRAITFNASAFYYDYRNLQVSRAIVIGSTVQSVITNAATSTIKGADVDIVAKPITNVELGLTYAYLVARYDKYTFTAPGSTASVPIDFSGTRLVRAPRHSLNTYAQYTLPLSSSDSLMFRAEYAYLSKFFFEPGEGMLRFGPSLPLTTQQDYGLLDFRVRLTHGNWTLDGYVSNVTDKYYRRTVNNLGNVLISYPGLPRTYGLKAGWRF